MRITPDPSRPHRKPVLRNFDNIRHYLTSGCDERIYPTADGRNKYGLDIFRYAETTHRGSCTCGTLCDDHLVLLDKLVDRGPEQPDVYESILEEQTTRLKSLINYGKEDKFDVFYAPSGSDLVYLPAVFCEILYPGRPILNLLSCPEELGSGTLHAVRGNYHAHHNQFEERIPKGQPIDPAPDIEVIQLQARGKEGHIVDHEAFLRQQVSSHPDHSVIVSLVYGSKSGIEDNLGLISRMERPDIMWTIDMCQFRHSRKIIHRLLNQRGCVMITGSKFYQGPPFCGAMLVHKDLTRRLLQGSPEPFSRLKGILSGYDLPGSLRGHSGLPLRQNIGLRLRWACSLAEIAQFRKIPKQVARRKIRQWNDFVTNRLRSLPEFELMPDQRVTNKTIISFRIRKDDRFLNHEELGKVYRMVVGEGRINQPSGHRIFIGQPVAYGDRSFLRVAIGSMCLREFIECDETCFERDAQIIEVIRQMAAALETAH